MNLKDRLKRRIKLERKRAEEFYAMADEQCDQVTQLELILACGDKEHWKTALEAFRGK